LFFLSSAPFASTADARPQLGDPEWMRRFRVFIKAFNSFVEALDDNKPDRSKWQQMREAWHKLELD
jgi:hypothetical protein